jgi:hypothetical protein
VLPSGVRSLTPSSSSSEVTIKRSVPMACANGMFPSASALTEYVTVLLRRRAELMIDRRIIPQGVYNCLHRTAAESLA